MPRPNEFAGLLGLTLQTKGIDVDLKIHLIPSPIHAYSKRLSYLSQILPRHRKGNRIHLDVNIEVKRSYHSNQLA